MAKHLTRKQWNNILHYDEDFDAWDLADALREVDRLQHAQWKLIQETYVWEGRWRNDHQHNLP